MSHFYAKWMHFLSALAMALTVAAAQSAPPAAQPATYRFDLAAQDLGSALRAFGQVSKQQIVFSEDLVRGKRSPALSGSLSADEALAQLLAGTGLRAQRSDLGVIVIERTPKETMQRVAAPQEEAPTAPSEEARGVPEILVRGSRSLNTDIARSEDAPQPYVVFARDEIQRSQAVNLEDFLKNRLPMNTSSGTRAQDPASANTTSSINLRGLGPNQTLILVDGRRMPSVTSSGRPGQPDINGIPMSAVERIEVLPSTAGGIYGGSATGGVINVILRRDFSGIETRATYANTFDTDSGAATLEGNTGFSLEGGRTRVMLSATYSYANQLLLGDRDFSARAIALQLKNNPAMLNSLSIPPLGGTVNIVSAQFGDDGQREKLQLDDEFGGAPLNSTLTHLPLGYAGPASDDGAALVRNAGSYNLDMPAGALGTERGLLASPEKRSATLNVRREFTDWLDVFVDLATFGNRGQSSGSGVSNLAYNLPADAPNNPFQQVINVTFPTPGYSYESRFKSDTLRATGGLIARLPHQWTGELDYGWSRSRAEGFSTPTALDLAAADALDSGEPSPDGRPALNALQEQNTDPIDFSDYLLPTPNQFDGPAITHLKDATLRLSGPTFAMPGGPLTLSALLERRREELKDFQQTIDVETYDWYYTYFPPRTQDVSSYYLEARAPLISSTNALPFARELELQASVRHDRYRTRSDGSSGYDVLSREGPFPDPVYSTSKVQSTDSTLGLRFAPLRDLALRASYGTGFLPPTVAQISPSRGSINFPYGFTDPKRGGSDIFVGQSIPYLVAGNPDLQPEKSRSWSAGAIFTPRFAPGLRLSLDYTKIDKSGEIQAPATQFVIDNADAFPGRITRGPKRAGEDPSWEGPITFMNLTYLNIAKTSVSAYDIQADYTLSTEHFADFHWYALATWQPHYKNQLLPTQPEVEFVGFSSGPLEWRGNIGVDWERGPLTIGWNAQYFDSYLIYPANSSQANINRLVANQGASHVSRQLYHDLIGSYRFDGGKSEISFGIQNLFNQIPPILASPFPYVAGYSTYGDPRLRRFTFSIRKSFGG